jgi:putative endopeptidase
MDEAAIEAAGLAPLAGELAAIDALSGVVDMPALFARLTRAGSSLPFGPMVFADLSDASQNLLYLVQDGMGLPEKDYYLRTDAESATLRDEYRAHIGRMLALLGDAQAEAHAAAILALETELAQNGYGALDFRDPAKLANKISMSDLVTLAPGFDWTAYLMALGLDGLQPVNVVAPDYFRALDGLLAARPLEEWQAFLRWHLVRSQADYLPRAFEQESFAFFGRTLGGAKEQRPRWKRVVAGVGANLGEGLGQLFVERTFSPIAKERCAQMVDDLLAAFRVRLEQLAWMSAETRARALAKLAAFKTKIGYPDRWRDYAGLELGTGSYAENHMRATAFELAWNLAKAGQPVDKDEWGMPAYIVNAGYNPTNNDITFPAGILQPPFFSEQYDDALNYGAMGAVIGHEITHGFDDEGSRFDAQGNFANWWTEADRAEFERRAAVVEQQFSEYVAVDDLKVNGKLTLGENLADLAGLTIAYDALMLRQANQRVAPIDGFTPEQRFFIAWARAWRSNDTPENRRLLVQTNPHAPADLRVLGPLSNLQAFQDAFGLPDDAPMLRPKTQRALIW